MFGEPNVWEVIWTSIVSWQSNKPLLEKKRRARINRSLEQLKSLVLDALKKDVSSFTFDGSSRRSTWHGCVAQIVV